MQKMEGLVASNLSVLAMKSGIALTINYEWAMTEKSIQDLEMFISEARLIANMQENLTK